MQAVCEADMQYGVRFNPKATFNTTASITCWTRGTILDTENRSPVWKSNVWQSVRVASRGHLLSLFDDNAQFRFPALAGRSEPEQEKWGHYPLLTLMTPPFPDPSRSWHTHSHSHSPEHTHTRERRAFDIIWFIVLCIIRTGPGVVSSTFDSVRQTTLSEALKYCESFFETVWMLGCF